MPVPFSQVFKRSFDRVIKNSLAPIGSNKWCRRFYKIPPSAGSVGGPFRAEAYQRVLMDILGAENMPYEQVTMMKAARIGWSSILIGTLMYQLAKVRRNILLYLPTEEFAKSFTKRIIDPSFLLCPPTASSVEEIGGRRDRRVRDTYTCLLYTSPSPRD